MNNVRRLKMGVVLALAAMAASAVFASVGSRISDQDIAV